jgi:predicted nucleic acid-binding Zn ribbon protein
MRRDNEQSLGAAIKNMLQKRGLDEKLLETEIYQRWEELAGKEINLKTKKVRFRNGTLEVFINSASLRQNLNMEKENLRQQVNMRLRNAPVQSLIVR